MSSFWLWGKQYLSRYTKCLSIFAANAHRITFEIFIISLLYMYSSLAVRWTMNRLPRWADFGSISLTEFSFVGTRTENLVVRRRKNVIAGTAVTWGPNLGLPQKITAKNKIEHNSLNFQAKSLKFCMQVDLDFGHGKMQQTQKN